GGVVGRQRLGGDLAADQFGARLILGIAVIFQPVSQDQAQAVLVRVFLDVGQQGQHLRPRRRRHGVTSPLTPPAPSPTKARGGARNSPPLPLAGARLPVRGP